MTAKDAAATLNDALRLDPAAISSLHAVRRTCNKALADHPNIQVWGEGDGPFWIRFVGLLNGLLLAAGSDEVVVAVEDDEANQNVVTFMTKPYSDFISPK